MVIYLGIVGKIQVCNLAWVANPRSGKSDLSEARLRARPLYPQYCGPQNRRS